MADMSSSKVTPGIRGDASVLNPTITVALILNRFYKGVGLEQKELFQYAHIYKKKWIHRKGFPTPLLDSVIFSRVKQVLGGRVKMMYDGNYRITNEPYPRGEIVVGGDKVSSYYYELPDETKEDFFVADGELWFRTGDIGEYHPVGVIKMIERKKDFVELQGGNESVSLGKVESQLKTSLAVKNNCVYPDKHKAHLHEEKTSTTKSFEDIVELILDPGRLAIPLKKNRLLLKDKDGQNILHHASKNGNTGVVKICINDIRFNVNDKDDSGCTPLWIASENGHTEVVKILLEDENIEINEKGGYDANTSLHIAVCNGHLEVVKMLLGHKNIKINKKDISGCTPFHIAVMSACNLVKTFEVLLKQLSSCFIDNEKYNENYTPLYLAAAAIGYSKIVKMLPKFESISVDEKHMTDCTPLHMLVISI